MLRKITFRPWGWWKNLFQGSGYIAKVITIKKGEQLSLQRHQYRSETWIIASGEGEIFANGIWQKTRLGKCVHIPVQSIHRAKATTEDLVIIEVQFGKKLSEKDIERFEDDYGRVESASKT